MLLWSCGQGSLRTFTKSVTAVRGLVEADTEDLEPRVMVLAIGVLKSRQLADARRAPGGPEIDQDVLSPERFQPDGLAGEVLGLEARCGLANPIQPFEFPGDLVTQAGAVGKPFLKRLVNLSCDRELTRRDGRGGEVSLKLVAKSS